MPDPITSARRDRDYSSNEDYDDKTGVCGATAKTPEPKTSKSGCDDADFHTPCLPSSYGGVSASEIAKNMVPLPRKKDESVASLQTNVSQTPENELAQVKARLARPADYAGRAHDEQTKTELEKVMAESLRTQPVVDPVCAPDEACQVVVAAPLETRNENVDFAFSQGTKSGTHAEYTIGVLRGHNDVTVGGVQLTQSAELLTAHEAIGTKNSDGSKGVGVSSLHTVIGSELTVRHGNDSVTFGVGLGAGFEASFGIRKTKDEPDASCVRMTFGPVTAGSCVTKPKDAP